MPSVLHPLFLLVLPTLAIGCAGKGESITLRLNPKLKTPYVYTITGQNTRTITRKDGTAGPPSKSGNTSMTYSATADSEGNGQVHLVEKILDYTSSDPLDPGMTGAKGAAVDITTDDRGKVISGTTSSDNVLAKSMANDVGVVFPKEPVHVGSTWTYSIDPSSALPQGVSSAPFVYKVTVEKIDPTQVTLQSVMDTEMTMNTAARSRSEAEDAFGPHRGRWKGRRNDDQFHGEA